MFDQDLIIASKNGDLNSVKQILAENVDINCKDISI